MEKLKIDRPIIVEGRYDKITLSAVLDAHVIPTNGFSIFNDQEKLALIRRLAAERGVIVLTDADGAGKLIRAHMSSALPKDRVIHLYTPAIEGKEKRKASPSKEGLLGVEGMEVFAGIKQPIDRPFLVHLQMIFIKIIQKIITDYFSRSVSFIPQRRRHKL